MSTVLISAALVISLAVIIQPFFSRRRDVDMPEGSETGSTVSTGKLRESLDELELDYRMNKLSDEDYHTLKTSYTEELQQMGGTAGNADVGRDTGDELEKEIERLRKDRT